MPVGLRLDRPTGKDATALTTSIDDRSGRLHCAHEPPRTRCRIARLKTAAAAICVWLVLAVTAAADIELPPAAAGEPIVIGADYSNHWTQGSYDVWLLRGNCYINQGLNYCRSQEAVLWIKQGDPFDDPETKVIAYLEGQVRLSHGGDPQSPAPAADHRQSGGWFGRFYSTAPVRLTMADPGPEPKTKPAVFKNAVARRDPDAGAIRRTQYEIGGSLPSAEVIPAGTRRLRIFQRSTVRPHIEWLPEPDGQRGVLVITGGVNFILDGLDQVGQIDVLADNVVIWTAGSIDASLNAETLQDQNQPLEIYMEGNIVFRQGDRTVYADSMYYDANQEVGTVLGAEILTPVPNFNGLARLEADVIQQTGRDRYFAHNAFITSSRMGQPGYRLQSSEIYFEDNQRVVIDPFTGNPQINPATNEPLVVHQKLATSSNNFLFLGPVPVFYWPRFATDLEDPTLFVRSAQLQNDRIFGLWSSIDLDAYQLLGWRNPPQGTDWQFGFDYLTDRGFGGGTTFEYNRADFFGMGGPTSGLLDAWAIDDDGLDNLGGGRMELLPEEDFRYRVLGRHRQQLDDFQLTAELGLISDRNFLEQYYEAEWDQGKDQTTGLELKRMADNASVSLTADARVNDFFTQTEWLPRLDHFWLGQPLLGNRLSWYQHSNLGYARLKTASTPLDPADAAAFDLLPWERESQGERFATRQEIDMPLELGPVKVVPYALGELAHWGEDLSGEPLDRAFGQVGLRASIPFWAADPTIESPLFNVHGLAHKVVVDADYSFADANRDLDELPLYDPLDDDSVEHFRRRFAFNTFGGMTPIQFDERFYALRSGLQNWVTSSSTEVADDLAALRLGLRQRWQTKRGFPGRRRIIDWIVLDTQAVFFPNADRDNFGETLGLVDYDFRWHVGDRLTLLSDAAFDFFDEGQRTVTVSAALSRPPRGTWFITYRSLGGPLDMQVVSTAYTYRLSPKWITSTGASYDFSGQGNIGQQLALTRIGESFLTSFAFNADSGKDNVGVSFLIEPRFLPTGRLGRVAGVPVPVAGLYGLE